MSSVDVGFRARSGPFPDLKLKISYFGCRLGKGYLPPPDQGGKLTMLVVTQ